MKKQHAAQCECDRPRGMPVGEARQTLAQASSGLVEDNYSHCKVM